jgi:hypothetical protein
MCVYVLSRTQSTPSSKFLLPEVRDFVFGSTSGRPALQLTQPQLEAPSAFTQDTVLVEYGSGIPFKYF